MFLTGINFILFSSNFNDSYNELAATRSALILIWITVGCLPLRNNGDPAKKPHLLQCIWTAAPFSQAAQAIVESPSPNVKTVFQVKSWREFHLLLPANLSLSLNVGGEGILQPWQPPLLLRTSPPATRG